MSDSNAPIEVAVDVKQNRDKSWMVFDGQTETKNGEESEVWHCLPKVLCKRLMGNEDEIGHATFEVPFWLAKEKGLI